jgi:hypothetical protein
MPAERLAALRILVGAFATIFVAGRTVYWLQAMDLPRYRWQPIGPLAWLDRPPPALLVLAATAVALAAGVAFVVGWRYRWTAPVFAVLLLGLTTYGNSWGHVFHSENLFVLHVGVLAIAPAADAWAVGRHPGASPLAPPAGYGWPVRLVTVVTLTTYVLAGWAKLRLGGVGWVTGDVLRNQVAHDNLRKIVVGDTHSRLGGALVGWSWFWRPIALVTVLVELGAFAVLLRRSLRVWWAATAWAFHVGIAALMAIVFAYPLSGVAFASLFAVERLVGGAGVRCASWLNRSRRAGSGERAAKPSSASSPR